MNSSPMQIQSTTNSPVTPPGRSEASRAADGLATAGFASLLRQSVQPPVRSATPPPPAMTPAPTPPSASPSASMQPQASATPKSADAASPDSATTGEKNSATRTPSSDAGTAPPAPGTAQATPSATSRALARGRAGAVDAKSAATAVKRAGGALPGSVDTDTTQAAADKSRKADAQGTGDATTDPAALLVPVPVSAAPVSQPPLSQPTLSQPPLSQTSTPAPASSADAGGPQGIGIDAGTASGTVSTATTAALGTPTLANAGGTGGPGTTGAARDAGAAPAGTPVGNDPGANAGSGVGLGATPPAASAFAGLLAEHRQGAEPATGRGGSAVDGSTAASGVGAAAFGTTPLAGTAAPPADVAAPVGSPDFAPQLGVQISLLTKAGVQHAELHLNPADMGPVSVQITMDGTQARIDFGADVAATRHAIESGLPQLASALADAGYTLAGGGVSQHSGSGSSASRDTSGGGSGNSNGSSAGLAGGATGDAVAPVAARRVTRIGALDLYA